MFENRTDEELMSLYQQGDKSAFRELYARHSAKVFSYITARIRHKEKAHDLFQEIFVKVHKSKNLYNKDFPFLAWIFTITKNTLTDEFRKPVAKSADVELESLAAVNEVSLDSSISEITPLIQELPEAQRRAIELRYYEEQTFEAIALTLKTSPLNVRQLISRGIKQIKTFVSEGEKP